MTAEENRFRERRSAYNPEEAEAEKPDADAPAEESTETIVGPGGEPVSAEPSSETASRPETAEPDDLDALEDVEVPPASFQEIVEPLVMRALQFLGEVPLTEGGDRKVVPRLARHMIDLLEILEERTEGNLEDDEERYLERVLSELRTRYVSVTK